MSTSAVILQPQAEPVTLEEAKAHIRYVQGDQDAVLTNMVKAARQQVEALIRLPVVSATFEEWFDAGQSHSPLWLRKAPAIGIVSLTTYDIDNTATTVNAASTVRMRRLGSRA